MVAPRTRAGHGAAESRGERVERLVRSTRELFDERGVQDVPLEEVARTVGINRALLYRYFESKNELFVLAMTLYLDEITAQGLERIDFDAAPAEQLRASWTSFADYCLRYPAFLDCAVSLMVRPLAELRESLSESTFLRIARSMSGCLAVTEEILRAGAAQGDFDVADPALAVNLLYAQTIGIMNLARLGAVVSRTDAGEPAAVPLAAEEVRDAVVSAALRAAGLPA